MNYLEKFIPWGLRNEGHNQYVTEFSGIIDELVSEKELAGFSIDLLLQKLKDLHGKEKLIIEQIQASPLTRLTSEADYERNTCYSSLMQMVKLMSKSYDAPRKNAAVKMLPFIRHYRNLRKWTYAEKTAAIREFITDIKVYDPELKTLGLDDWKDKLVSANDRFSLLMKQRLDIRAQAPDIDMLEIRSNIDRVLASITAYINAEILVGNGADYSSCVSRLNTRIGFYKTQTNMRKARKLTPTPA